MKSQVTLWPSGKIVDVDSKKSLFEELKKQGIDINSTCGGCATCALCTVVVRAGAENLNEMTFEEKQLLGNVFHITYERLSCQTYVNGPVTIDISAHEKKTTVPKSSKVVRRKPQEQEQKEPSSVERKPKAGGFKRPKKFDYKD